MYLDEPLLDRYGLAVRAGDSSPRPSTYCRSARWYKQLKRVHYRRAEELAAEAHRPLGQGDGQAAAGAWASLAQTHAVLALAAATAVGASSADSRA
jgi:hypothetical protein